MKTNTLLVAPTIAVSAAAVLYGTAIAGTGNCNGELQIEALPTPEGADTTRLHDVTVLAPNNIWAVGMYTILSGPDLGLYSLAMHFDGAQWNIVPTPTPVGTSGERSAAIEDVTFLSPDLGYAAGYFKNGSSQSTDNFVLRWNGSEWQHVECPGQSGLGLQGFLLETVEAIDQENIWFGGQWGGTHAQASMLHFDGSTFEVFLLPRAPDATTAAHRIRAIDATSPDDVWAVGSAGGIAVATGRNYVAHWDGSSWVYMLTPQPGTGEILRDVAAIAPDDVWVCGRYQIYTPEFELLTLPLLLHWNGSGWTQHESPAFAEDLVALATDNIYGTDSGKLVHWDGVSWSLIDQLSGGPMNFNGIDVIGPCELVLVGSEQFSTQNEAPLAARFRGQAILADITADGLVNVNDLLAVINAWGACPESESCPADIAPASNDDGVVNANDLLMVINNWG